MEDIATCAHDGETYNPAFFTKRLPTGGSICWSCYRLYYAECRRCLRVISRHDVYEGDVCGSCTR